MDKCRHVNRITPAADHSILNPQKWLCSFCGTTESVWACLSCSNVACGRYNEEHALRHYTESKHPLAIEVNDKYVYCYVCDEYILNDNAAGDIKILRSALSAIATHTFSDFESRGKRVLRSLSVPGYEKKWQDERKLQNQDRQFTALKFRRYYLLARIFTSWRTKTLVLLRQQQQQLKQRLSTLPACCAVTPAHLHTPPKKSQSPASRKLATPPLASTLRKRPAVIPGVTGLRNLGNTCYMNSVLQVLRSFLANFSHVQEFQEYFISMKNAQDSTPSAQVREVPPAAGACVMKSASGAALGTPVGGRRETRHSHRMLLRQSTIECFKHLSTGRPCTKKGGLNGGASMQCASHRKQLNSKSSKQLTADNNTYTLCEELHALFRVMWSGKWAVVSPHKMLYAVWNIIPFFKGYTQQDAQEFLCEFIDKVQGELTRGVPGAATPPQQMDTTSFISNLFQGKLVSEVRCRRCSHRSQTFEPFMDLSLEFPDRYQATGGANKKSCHLEEMLRKFTESEKLDGQIYACEECNKRRRSVAARPTVRTEAEKQLLIKKLPAVLRLHLKRFMWSGRNHRGKLTSHVQFEEELDMAPYCHAEVRALCFTYELSAVVIHHGRGFGSGHYTTYCYNREADSWVHCNDARVQLSSMTDVLRAQAYILFYTQKRIIHGVPSEGATTGDDGAFSSSARGTPPGVNTGASAANAGGAAGFLSPFEEKADDEIVFNFQNSSIPKFLELKRRLNRAEDERRPQGPKAKRSKSNMW